jgi:hypothetical protein
MVEVGIAGEEGGAGGGVRAGEREGVGAEHGFAGSRGRNGKAAAYSESGDGRAGSAVRGLGRLRRSMSFGAGDRHERSGGAVERGVGGRLRGGEEGDGLFAECVAEDHEGLLAAVRGVLEIHGERVDHEDAVFG